MRKQRRGTKKEHRWNQIVNAMNGLRWWSTSAACKERHREILKGRRMGGVWIIAFHLDNLSI